MKNRSLSIYPPEGVPISFTLASLGARFGAQFIDILLTFGGIYLLLLILVYTGIANLSFLLTLYFLLVFLVRTPYYIFSELVWNGRTVGKRLSKIRVVSADGTRLSPYQVTARNLMKEVEVFMPLGYIFGLGDGNVWLNVLLMVWVIGIFCVPIFNKRNQRLGDMIAGTLVVDQPAIIMLSDLAVQSEAGRVGFVFTKQQLGFYGRYELQTLEKILREPLKTPEAISRAEAVAQAIQRKIGYEEKLRSSDHWDFLSDFYRQQREFLESRHLFGDTRENKFHQNK